jgi:N-methylhydantoinase A/oxoprolinase/acetone carboxylase beta subunit
MSRKVRMGIDVGGTHTKAVAIDNDTQEIIGKSTVKTTHDDKAGVATGVVKAFQNCLKENSIDPADVVFVAHSTTQATNALVEGDVAKVGIIGTALGGIEGVLSKIQVNLKDIHLDSNKKIEIISEFIPNKEFTPEKVKSAATDLKERGAQVIVATSAFGEIGRASCRERVCQYV